MKEQAKFTYSLLRKAFEKQRKTVGDVAEKQTKSWQTWKTQIMNEKQLEIYFQKIFLTTDAKDEL